MIVFIGKMPLRYELSFLIARMGAKKRLGNRLDRSLSNSRYTPEESADTNSFDSSLHGDITNIQARFEDFTHKNSTEFEDSGVVNFEFVNGGLGSINYSTAVWDANLESSILIIGEKGSIKVGGQYMNIVEYCHIQDYTMPTLPEAGPANDYGPYKGSAANHHLVIKNVVDTLKGRTTVSTNALEGLKVVDIIERIYACKR